MKEKRGPSLLKELPTGRWADRVGYHLSRGRKGDALRLLERLIEADLPLFNQSEWMARERRLAWMLRIELLLQWNRFSEALAWTCLEVEVNPANVAAAALKERLKRQLGLSPEQRRKGAEGAPRDAVTFEWKGVAGMRELKAMLERDVILPLQEPEIYERYRVSLPNGVVLYGPPGCGKTFIARNLAKKLGFHFEEIKPSSLSSTYVHGTQEKIGALFAEARKKKPCMLFFDELDALTPDRGGFGMSHHYAAEVNEFLVNLNECWKTGVLVVAATNLLENIDPAILRPGRLDKKVFVGPPDFEARVELLQLCMKDRPQDKIDWLGLATQLENYTCAEIEFLVDESARKALGPRRLITTEDIRSSAQANPPAHTPEKIEKMRRSGMT